MDPTNANTALASAMTEELARSGVRHAVVSPGSRSTPLAVALSRQEGIDLTISVDERSGGFFALGAAKASGKPVALLCTSGTAAANYHPAVAEADLSSAPLIILTADRPPELRDIGAGQTIDQIKLYGSAVRWFCEVGTHEADDDGLTHFRATACRAFAVAAGDPRPGPVHLNVPLRDPLAPIPVHDTVSAGDRLSIEGRAERALTVVAPAHPGLTPGAAESLSAILSSSERALIVAGRQTSGSIGGPAARFAELAAAPILAEPTSQLRCGPHDRSRVIAAYDRIAADPSPELAPDLIVRIGEMPTSKALRTWLGSLEDLRQVVIDPGYSWNEPLRTADLIVRADVSETLEAMGGMLGGRRSSDYLERWLSAGAAAEAGIEAGLSSDRPSAGSVHRTLAGLHQDGDLVYTASSMAIRDQEHYLATSETDLFFLANRGANGIDGLIASATGAAVATRRPTTVITGDLGFQHDLGSLALLAHCPVPVKIVVLNDDGGRIFSRLPQKQVLDQQEFETLMKTPTGLDLEAAAGMFGTPYRRVSELSQLYDALAAGSGVIEIPIAG